MKYLFKAILRNRSHLCLLIFTLAAMVCLTFASQLEIFSLGVITKKGPDFFELFAPASDGHLVPTGEVTKTQLETTWQGLDPQNKGYVTQEDSAHYLAQFKRHNILDRVVSWANRVIPIDDSVGYLALFLVVVALLKAVAMFYHRFITRLVAIRVSRDLRLAYFQHIQTLPLNFYQKYNVGSLSSRVVTDAAVTAEAINSCLINYFETPFKLITTLLLCFYTSWQLSIIIFIGFPLIVYPIIFLAKKVKKISKQVQKNQETFASVIIEFLSGIQTVKAFAMEEFSLKKYKEQNARMAALEQKSAKYDTSSRPILHTIAMFFLSTALVYGLYVLQMSVAEVLVYSGLLYIFYEPIKKFAEENSHIQRGIAAAERMFDIMELQPQIQDHDGAIELVEIKDSIEFDNVWFRYEDEWILKGVSFKIKKGETVGIVGPTGSGKSTIVQLIPRLYEVEQGEIRIDGKPISAYTQRSLRDAIAFVPQRPFLFLDTIAENIAFGRPFSREEIREAAKKAHAAEFIDELPNGYDTELSEAGKNLSGGQQQRLAIARALVKNAPVLMMDEATSSLDAISEHHIKTAIKQLHGEATQIIIAHRLSIIEDADKIIYIEKGEKIAEGTKDELLERCPSFARMWEMAYAYAMKD